MYKIMTVAGLAMAATALSVPAAMAEGTIPTPSVQACLDSHPGAVMFDGVTAGNDLVCIDEFTYPSEGDDTYLWVPTNEGTTVLRDPYLSGSNARPDAGNDTLSLALWHGGFTGLLYGKLVIMDPSESLKYTPYNDTVGTRAADGSCSNITSKSFITSYFGAGDDTVICRTGVIFTGTGADYVQDGGWGTTVTTGDGNDEVVAGGGADSLILGAGDDTARVKNGGEDVVKAGDGSDVAYASPNDTVLSAKRL